MSLLEIKNLNLTYPNGKKIFENAEITLQPGESQALWSPNGTGKMLSSTCTKFSTIRNCRIESIAKPEMHEHWHTHFYGGVPHTHHEST